jgi:hypothetical protein
LSGHEARMREMRNAYRICCKLEDSNRINSMKDLGVDGG